MDAVPDGKRFKNTDNLKKRALPLLHLALMSRQDIIGNGKQILSSLPKPEHKRPGFGKGGDSNGSNDVN